MGPRSPLQCSSRLSSRVRREWEHLAGLQQGARGQRRLRTQCQARNRISAPIPPSPLSGKRRGRYYHVHPRIALSTEAKYRAWSGHPTPACRLPGPHAGGEDARRLAGKRSSRSWLPGRPPHALPPGARCCRGPSTAPLQRGPMTARPGHRPAPARANGGASRAPP